MRKLPAVSRGHAMSGLNRIEVVLITLLLGSLLVLALPWLVATREDARLVQCRENLRQIGIALAEYAELSGHAYPYGTIVNAQLPPQRRIAWTVPTTAVRDHRVLAVLDIAAGWKDALGNNPDRGDADLRQFFLRFARFHCPADTNISPPNQLQFSSYVGMAGVGKDTPAERIPNRRAGIWGYERQTPLRDITDGLKHTVCVLETSRNNGPWIAGGPPTIRPLLPEEEPYLTAGGQFGGHHRKGCVILFADGSVRLFSRQTDEDAFRRLCTAAEEKPAGKGRKSGR